MPPSPARHPERRLTGVAVFLAVLAGLAGSVQIARRISATRGDAVVRLVVDDYRALED